MGLRVNLFDDLWVEILPESDGCMCLNHGKYLGFCEVQPFPLICSGRVWDFILRGFRVPCGQFLWFWRVLETGWNFDVFWGLTWGAQVEATRSGGGLCLVWGGLVNSYQHQIADPQTVIRQDTRLANRQLQNGYLKTVETGTGKQQKRYEDKFNW